MENKSGRTRICTHAAIRKRGVISLNIVTLAVSALALIVPCALAGDLFVDGNLGNDAGPCTGTGILACRTIQAAVDKASPGDTIHVTFGTYPEPAPGPLTINKTLTLLGNQAGVDARTRAGLESVVTDPQGTSVSADGVIIAGFTFQNSVSPFPGFGIWLNPGVGGTEIIENIIQNNIVGIGLANDGAQAFIRFNLIRNNNVPGSASGTGIYTDQFAGGSVVRDVIIDSNAFVGNNDAAIDSSNTAASGGVFNVQVSFNSFDSNGRALVLFNTHDWVIRDNSIPNSTLPLSASIRIFDNNSNLAIGDNDILTGAFHAIRLTFTGSVGGPSSSVRINFNNIGTVGPGSFPGDGLLVDPGSHVGTVNAECNWWGSPTGPINPSNPTGAGEEVVGNADFTPWLSAPRSVGACVGGISTPGKVTGGGQIPGEDPVFSPLGDLISIPALVPSLSNPKGKATLGFTVKCCPASGNLEYNDHEAGVRIKAQTIDNLVITAGTCGANTHATFTGTAEVIRSTGTTTEPFTVEVDDCGEPGTMDTFAIRTTTYSNGPSTLVGGNIKIHRQ